MVSDEDDDMMAPKVEKALKSLTDDYNSIFTMQDVHSFLSIIGKHFHTLTVYIIEPYIEQITTGTLKIPASENYSIEDHGGRLIVAPDDIWATPLFATTGFFAAIEQLLQLVLDAGATEIAILGDSRAKGYLWDRVERLKTLENIPISIINFSPAEAFKTTREAVINYLRQHGMVPITRPKFGAISITIKQPVQDR